MLPPRASHMGLVRCHVCGMSCESDGTDASDRRCGRCDAPLHGVRGDRMGASCALLLAALICYVPANIMPVMYTQLLGRGSENTILQGVAEFWRSGSYGIALVIFVASVAVPCTKFMTLGLLLIGAQRKTPWKRRERAVLYRLVEIVGYWSMLDVLVVAVVAALVKFGALGDVEPRVGILFFGAVVILTMLSAMQFDPRLTWSGDES